MSLNLCYLNLLPLLSELFLIFLICFCLIFGSLVSNLKQFHFPLVQNSIQFFTLQGVFLSFILLVNSTPIFFDFWNKLLIADSFTFYGKLLIFFFTLSWLFIFQNSRRILNFEFWILILLSILALNLLIQANDLLSIYLLIEFFSLIFYILASFNRISEFSTEAGLKYFILGAFASSFLLFGFSLLYNFIGVTNLNDLFIFFASYQLSKLFIFNKGLFISIICILIALFFKLGVAPFHFWLSDIYEGAPMKVTAFFATLPKFVILLVIFRFIFTGFGTFLFNEIYFFLIFCTFTSNLIGTAGAFLQKKWKRFVAFSSISHISFFLINFCSLTLLNIIHLIIYLIIYLFTIYQFFSIFSFVQEFKFPKKINLRFFNSLIFLNITNPLLALIFSISLFSLAGIPPLAGFFAKFFVLFSAISFSFFFLVFSMLLLNCISCFYYINLIKKNYFNNLNFSYLPVFVSESCNLNPLILNLFTLILILIFLDLDFIFLIANLMCGSFLII
nr:NADH dehydrogenase subunit 2 [Polysiphonia sp.]